MTLAPAERLRDLEEMIIRAVPPIDPPGCHWLNSDATFSYCWKCAREAAWRELPSIGPVPPEQDYWLRDPIEALIQDRIDGPSHGESDCPEQCETCGVTLRYLLTDYGVEQELDHFLEHPLTEDRGIYGFGPETSYELSRIFMELTWDGADARRVADALTVAEGALAALSTTC